MQSEAVVVTIARAGSMSNANSQCLSVLQKERHNEHPIATGRVEFSARLVDSSRTGYFKNSVSFSHGVHFEKSSLFVSGCTCSEGK